MFQLDLTVLTKRWQAWCELNQLMCAMGVFDAADVAFEGTDDAPLSSLPGDLVVPRLPRLD